MPDPRSFLPLTPLALQVLLAIAGEARHGYGIIREVDERTNGLIRLKTGTLYVLLRRLADEALIVSAEKPSGTSPKDDERRKYYEMTPLGRAVIKAEALRLESVVGEARRKRVLGRASTA